MRRSTVLFLAAAALVLAACEIRTNYAMVIDDDTSATLAFEIAYDAEAAELFGPAESFLEEEIESEAGPDIEGVTLLSAEADSSDPENHRVTATFGARDGEAFDRLVSDLFPDSSFTNDGGSTWVLTLRPDADVAEEFGDEFALDELGLDFLSGEVRIDHAGSQVSMTGGTSEGGNQVVWNPYGADSLEVVMDLSGATPPDPAPGDDGPVEEPGEEIGDEVTEEPAEEPADEPSAEESEAEDPGADEDGEEVAAIAAIADEDSGGLSTWLVAVIAGALLVVALLLFLVLRARGQGPDTAPQPAGQPASVGPPSGGYQPPAPPAPTPPSAAPPRSSPSGGDRPQPPPPPPPRSR
jgi:hypothetical protein